jgi:hypothetical protein
MIGMPIANRGGRWCPASHIVYAFVRLARDATLDTAQKFRIPHRLGKTLERNVKPLGAPARAKFERFFFSIAALGSGQKGQVLVAPATAKRPNVNLISVMVLLNKLQNRICRNFLVICVQLPH